MNPKRWIGGLIAAAFVTCGAATPLFAADWASGGALGDPVVATASDIRVYSNTPSGTPTTVKETVAVAGVEGMAFGDDMTLYAISGNQILRLSQASGHAALSSFAIGGLCASAQSIVIDGGGKLYVGCRNGIIQRYSSAGAFEAEFTVNPSGTTLHCLGLDLETADGATTTAIFTKGTREVRRIVVSGATSNTTTDTSTLVKNLSGPVNNFKACGIRRFHPNESGVDQGYVVADARAIRRVSGTGTETAVLNSSGNNFSFVVLDPNNTHLWALNGANGNAVKVAINGSSAVATITTGATVKGLALNGEPLKNQTSRLVTFAQSPSPVTQTASPKFLATLASTLQHSWTSTITPADYEVRLIVRALEVNSGTLLGNPSALFNVDSRLPSGAVPRPGYKGRSVVYRVIELTTKFTGPTSVVIIAPQLTSAEEASIPACPEDIERTWRQLRAPTGATPLKDQTQSLYSDEIGIRGGSGGGYSDFILAGICGQNLLTIDNPKLKNDGSLNEYQGTLVVRVAVLNELGQSLDFSTPGNPNGQLVMTIVGLSTAVAGQVTGSTDPVDPNDLTQGSADCLANAAPHCQLFVSQGISSFFTFGGVNSGNLNILTTSDVTPGPFVKGETYNLCVTTKAIASGLAPTNHDCVAFIVKP
jgi:hypothetical protein